LKEVFLGPRYHEKEIEDILLAKGIDWSRPHNLASRISDALIEGQIVGLFQGKMEYGPRALGNRSILAVATDPTMRDTLNARLKRTDFMPFAPAILEEHAAEWFPAWRPQDVSSQFMTMTYNVAPSLAALVSEIVHIDGTARPQIVRKNSTPLLHNILTLYHNHTGIPLVINTSFNMHEDPIVCSPKDALMVYLLGAVDILVMEGILVDRS
jgi:carbamoyltransferase